MPGWNECILRRAENFNHGCLAGGVAHIIRQTFTKRNPNWQSVYMHSGLDLVCQ